MVVITSSSHCLVRSDCCWPGAEVQLHAVPCWHSTGRAIRVLPAPTEQEVCFPLGPLTLTTRGIPQVRVSASWAPGPAETLRWGDVVLVAVWQ